jgi:sugar phosphate isomerase/epimerase
MLWKDCIKGEGDPSSMNVILDDPYFDALEITRINDASARARMAEKVRASGKWLGFGAQPVLLTQKLDLNHADEAERRKAIQGVLDVIPQAYELGARGFGVLSGKAVAPADQEAAKSRLVASLCEIASALKQRGTMPLLLETFDRLPYGKNCLIGPNADAAAIAREVRKLHPDFGLMLDLSHLPLQGETPRQAWSACGPYVTHAHMGNCVMEKPGHPMNGDEHPPFSDPAGRNGVPELTEYLRVLLEEGYLSKARRPFLSFEVCVYGDWTREHVIQQCKETLDAAWAQV